MGDKSSVLKKGMVSNRGKELQSLRSTAPKDLPLQESN